MKKLIFSGAICMLISLTAQGTELVHQFVNPSFGGNPLNGSMLLNSAQAQNDIEDPSTRSTSRVEESELQKFNSLLQRSILSRLASSITSSIIGSGGELIPGTIETSSFTIEIVDLGDGVLNITTTDKATGDSTSFQLTNNI